MTGLQIAAINMSTTGTFNGIQVGIFNGVNEEVNGIQLGGGNFAGNMTGVELAFYYNGVEHLMRGVQVGLIGNGSTREPFWCPNRAFSSTKLMAMLQVAKSDLSTFANI